MANIGMNFDATLVEPQAALEPIPAAWYVGIITSSEVKQSKANPQHGYVEFGIRIVTDANGNGTHAGRMVFDRVNLWNSNAIAAEIAQKTLSAICHATGQMHIQDTNVLHGIPMELRVSVRPAHDGYDASNEVKGYRKVGSGAAPGANGTGAVAPGAAPTAPGAASPPWGVSAPSAPPAPPQAAGPPIGSAEPTFTPPWGAQTAPPPAPPTNPTPPPAPPPAPAAPPAGVPAGAGAPATPPWM